MFAMLIDDLRQNLEVVKYVASTVDCSLIKTDGHYYLVVHLVKCPN